MRNYEEETMSQNLETTYNPKEIESKLYEIKDNEQELYRMTNEINKEELWEIPQPTKLMSAKTYLNKIIEPYINKLKKNY